MKMKLAILGAMVFIPTIFPVAQADTIYGGWNEETGYYTVSAPSGITTYAYGATNTPKHTGERVRKDETGNTYYKAKGITIWSGRHYTTARMEADGSVLTTSGRVYGVDKTIANSPWYKFKPTINENARTYYGR